jgi:hypothetical protein
MKIYKREKINYWFDVFDNFKPFDEVDVDDIIPLYDLVDEQIVDRYMGNNQTTKGGGDRFEIGSRKKLDHNNEYFTHYHLSFLPKVEYENPSVKEYFFGTENKNTYSLIDRCGDVSKKYFDCGIVHAVRSQKIFDSKKLIYLEFPKQIILDYLNTLSNWDIDGLEPIDRKKVWDDLQYFKIRKFVDEVEFSDDGWRTSNWIKIINEYDQKYPDLVKNKNYKPECGKPPFYYMWRKNFNIEWYLVHKEFGLIYPVVSLSNSKLFSDGIHRLTNNALSGYNLPFFIKRTQPLLDKTFIRCLTPAYFNNKCLLLEVNTSDKEITFSFVNKDIFIYKEYINYTVEDGNIQDKEKIVKMNEILETKKIFGVMK